MLLKTCPWVRDSTVELDCSEDEKQKFVLAQSLSVHEKGKISFFFVQRLHGLSISLCFSRNLRQREQTGFYSHIISQFILLINMLSFPDQLTIDLQNPAFTRQE